AGITLTGRDNYNSSETLGNVTFEGGLTQVTVANGANGVRSTVLAFGNVSNTGGATLNFNTLTGQMGSAPRWTINNGSSLLVNGIIPWMVSAGNELVGYVTAPAGNTAGGVGTLSAVGYQGYDGTVLPTSNNATGNYRI